MKQNGHRAGFQLLDAVPMEKVPEPVMRASRGRFEPVFQKLLDLKRGTALPIKFAEEKHGVAARVALRKIAKRGGGFLSSSKSPDGLTFYFWVEPDVPVRK